MEILQETGSRIRRPQLDRSGNCSATLGGPHGRCFHGVLDRLRVRAVSQFRLGLHSFLAGEFLSAAAWRDNAASKPPPGPDTILENRNTIRLPPLPHLLIHGQSGLAGPVPGSAVPESAGCGSFCRGVVSSFMVRLGCSEPAGFPGLLVNVRRPFADHLRHRRPPLIRRHLRQADEPQPRSWQSRLPKLDLPDAGGPATNTICRPSRAARLAALHRSSRHCLISRVATHPGHSGPQAASGNEWIQLRRPIFHFESGDAVEIHAVS